MQPYGWHARLPAAALHGHLYCEPGRMHPGLSPPAKALEWGLPAGSRVADARRRCTQMLLLVGPALQAELGAVGFLLLYLAGGVLANLAAYVWNSSIKKRRRWTFQARPPNISQCLCVSTWLLLAKTMFRLVRRHFAGRIGLSVRAAGLQRHRGPVPALCVALWAAAELAGVRARQCTGECERVDS